MEILKNKDLSKQILNSFSKLSKLPEKGFLAGGAVANYILEMEWGGSYPINDLDIFIETEFQYASNTPDRSQELTIISGYDHFSLGYDYNTRYQIRNVEIDGLINTIYVNKYTNSISRDYMYIINSFDFNCCQVGIDLETSTLIYTKNFEEFLRTKQLKVCAPYTPPHTAIRLFKKMDELKCYCDIESEMKLLSQPYHFDSVVYNKRSFGLFFGVKYKELYEKYKDKIEPYFKLCNFYEFKEKLWVKSIIIDKKLYDNQYPIPEIIPESYIEEWEQYNGKVWGLLPVKYDEIDPEIEKICSNLYNPLMIMSVWKLLYGKHDKSFIQKSKIALSGKYTKILSLIDTEFFNCDFDRKSVNDLNKFCLYNFNLMPIAHKLKINLQKTIQLQKDIKKIINKEGVWYEEKLYRILYDIKDNTKIGYDDLVNTLENEKEFMNVPLSEPINLEELYCKVLLPKNVIIREINTECDLAWAGKKLSNCLNNSGQNYINKIKDGNVKIFVIITENSMSAIEFHKQTKIYKEKQLLSYCNRIASDYHRHIGNILKTYLNMQKLNEYYNNMLNYYEDVLDNEQDNLFCTDDESTENNEIGNINFGEIFFDETNDDQLYIDDDLPI